MDDITRLAEKIYKYVGLPINPIGQNTTKREWFEKVESLLREAMEEAHRGGVKFGENREYTESQRRERMAVKEAYTRAAEVARKYCRGGDFCLGRGCTACQIAAAIEKLKEDK